mmetsp:Transcript_4218/g.5245  ORF Transcript_4218/g.5245 Transcript_4218/m.5245 type:complete len:153 (+) Transcript_4218:21-479(+)
MGDFFVQFQALANDATDTGALDADLDDANETLGGMEETSRREGPPGRRDGGRDVIHPYGFVAEDWYWMIQMAVTNATVPALVYVIFDQWNNKSKLRVDVLRKIAVVHAAVWSPLVLLGMCVEWFGFGKKFTTMFLEHWSSNLNQAAYMFSLY